MTLDGFIGIITGMKVCEDCGTELVKQTARWCKPHGYLHRKRPSGLKYNLVKENPTSFKKGHIPWDKGLKGMMNANATSFKAGYHPSPLTEFQRGMQPWNKGIAFEAIRDDKHHAWKGDGAQYITKHDWVYRRLGKPSLCTNCGRTEAKRFDWHNISGNYKRDIKDWIRLCSTCHGLVHRERNRLRREMQNG